MLYFKCLFCNKDCPCVKLTSLLKPPLPSTVKQSANQHHITLLINNTTTPDMTYLGWNLAAGSTLSEFLMHEILFHERLKGLLRYLAKNNSIQEDRTL